MLYHVSECGSLHVFRSISIAYRLDKYFNVLLLLLSTLLIYVIPIY